MGERFRGLGLVDAGAGGLSHPASRCHTHWPSGSPDSIHRDPVGLTGRMHAPVTARHIVRTADQNAALSIDGVAAESPSSASDMVFRVTQGTRHGLPTGVVGVRCREMLSGSWERLAVAGPPFPTPGPSIAATEAAGGSRRFASAGEARHSAVVPSALEESMDVYDELVVRPTGASRPSARQAGGTHRRAQQMPVVPPSPGRPAPGNRGRSAATGSRAARRRSTGRRTVSLRSSSRGGS